MRTKGDDRTELQRQQSQSQNPLHLLNPLDKQTHPVARHLASVVIVTLLFWKDKKGK
jgi:hypothetical protein